MSLKIPRIIGHRGAAAYAPENTLEGFHTAADMGIEWVEFDVKLTKDFVPILFHDDSLERTTNGGDRPIAQLTLDDVRQLEAGSWFGESFSGLQIPTLEEALDVLIERDLGFNLEIKPCPGREKETAESALDVLSQMWDENDRLLLSSFSNVSMETAMDMMPDAPRGFLLPEEWPENWREMFDYLMPSTIHVNGNSCTQDDIDLLLDLQKPIFAYTINDPERAEMLQEWGVYGFFSDEPDGLKDVIFSMH